MFITWDFDPTIITIFGFDVRYYSLMWALGLYQGLIVLNYIMKREHEPETYADTIFWYMAAATILGARLGHCLFYEPSYYLANPIQILNFRAGGLASHGATIGIMIGLFLFCRKYKKTYLWMLDRAALVVPIGAFLIRMGNLFNSEIYGEETTQPWGFIFVRAGEIVPKHPAQVYEALVYLALFFVLMFLYIKKDAATKYPGMLIGVFFTILFSGRFLIETIKEVQVDFEINMALNMGQWLSIPFILLGIWLIMNSLRINKTNKK